MRPLIAIVTCGKYRERAAAQRRTWIKEAQAFDVRFFFGHGNEAAYDDEVVLDCPDDYPSLRLKVQRMFRWAVDAGYQQILKTDDDVLILPERLATRFRGLDYVGRVRGPSQENDAPRIYGNKEVSFCSGFGYILSARAADVVANAPDNGDWAEDRFAGQALFWAGIRPLHDIGFLLWPPPWGHFCTVPNRNCAGCQAQYAHACVICPYARPNMPEVIYGFYKANGGFIPPCL